MIFWHKTSVSAHWIVGTMRSVQPQLRCSRGRVARIIEIKIFMKNTHKEYANPLKHRECVLHVAKLISDQWKTSSCLAMSINVYNIEDDKTFIIYWLIIYLEFPTYLNTFYVFSNFTPIYYVFNVKIFLFLFYISVIL